MEAQIELEEHKQENMMLQETIDRVRFEMDTIRQSLNNASASDVEIAWYGAARPVGRVGAGLEVSAGSTAVEDDDTEGEADADEDMIGTIITNRKQVRSSQAVYIY